MGPSRKISIEEVSRHTSADDCWFIIHGRVYDITGLLDSHPGGTKILLKYAGRDATLPFDDVGHSMESLVYDMAPGSYLGEVDTGENVNRRSSVSWSSPRWLRSWDKDASEDATVQSLGSQSEKLESDFHDWLKKTLLLLVICVCCVLLLVIRYHNRTRRAGRTHSRAEAPLPSDTSGMPSWWDLVPTQLRAEP
ncbi:AaceriADL085Cp [[Ashbya] aceris (nom. inval.)]|nr:AaceriADL085Cp [[Ashbya] aceris (nom. inval.)]